MDFKGLQAVVKDYVNRADVGHRIPGWIVVAQRRLERKYNFRHMRGGATGTLLATAYNTITIPTRYKETDFLKVRDGDNDWKELDRKSLRYAHAYKPNLTSDTGRPEIFAADHRNSVFVVRPTADIDYPWQHEYFAYTAELSDNEDTNWWTTNAWEILLAGALREAARFMRNHESASYWIDEFTEILIDFKKEHVEEELSGSTPKSGATVTAA